MSKISFKHKRGTTLIGFHGMELTQGKKNKNKYMKPVTFTTISPSVSYNELPHDIKEKMDPVDIAMWEALHNNSQKIIEVMSINRSKFLVKKELKEKLIKESIKNMSDEEFEALVAARVEKKIL